MLTVSTPSNAQQGQVADVKVFLSFRPTTIGLGQELLINVWISPAPGAHRQYHDLKLAITKPDGSKLEYVLETYVADGTVWMPYVCEQVGEWTFQVVYPGEYFAAGTYMDGNYYAPGEPLPPGSGLGFSGASATYTTGVTISPASTGAQKLTVQEEMIPSWTETSLPTDYWTRPVGEENREWWPILGSYPWWGDGVHDRTGSWDLYYPNTNPTYNSAYGFVPWVSGPESAHIVWKRTYQIGGLMGGDWGGASNVAPSINGWGMRPDLIFMGRAFHTISKPSSDGPGSQTYWQSYDVRTGEIFWERPLYAGETAPNLIEYTTGAVSVEAAVPNPTGAVFLSISNGYLRKYNPLTGAMTANISIAPMTGNGGTYYMNGHMLGIQDLGADAGSARYRLINWTTLGTSANFTSRVISNTTYARSALPSAQLIDWNVGLGATASGVSEGGIYVGQNITGFNLLTGETLWNKYVAEPQYSGSANVADHGLLAILSAKGYYVAYDLRTGNEAWRTRSLDYPWDEPAFGSYSVTSAYGQLYWVAQTGVYAIDWKDGNINWKFEKDAPPFETPYTGRNGQTVYPFDAALLCVDGKLYTYTSEHTPDVPFFRGSPLVCIDAFTGKEVWSIGMTGAGEFARAALQIAIADGYMTFGQREGIMYTFGKGLSETTVSVSQVPFALGQKALITGTVFDLSPAQPGTPCVSKESMAAQMEHIHMGVGVGGVFSGIIMNDGTYGDVMLVGVPVSLDVLDPNGNYYNIGTVTSDGYSGTFSCAWKPDVPGEYTITATFMGDESYGSSFATTYLTVPENSDASTSNTVLYAVIGATVAIIVTIVLVGFIFRKK
jgi:hypothetical protein